MTTTAEQMRAWRGPAILTYGFRPFFLGAALWALLAMVLWVPMLAGALTLPTAFDPVSWHAHEFLFGYVSAVIGGFLLTAVPNWSGRLPVVGWPLAGLVGLWLLGRLAVMFSAGWPPLAIAVLDLAGMATLWGYLAREIILGRNWKNLAVLGILTVFILGNAVFHYEAAQGGYAAAGVGLRIGLGAGIALIILIGGRIVPSFTRNWLVKAGVAARPAPMGMFDKLAVLVTLAAIVLWVIAPLQPVTGLFLIICAAAQSARLWRWRGWHTRREPLVWILHLAYGFIPLGALAMGVSVLRPDLTGSIAAQHLWMAGAIGTMTVAVMTRATLGHTGQALTAGTGTVLIYAAIVGAVVARFLAGLFLAQAMVFYYLAGVLWCLGFAGYAVVYGPLLLRPRAKV
jgi:uncharacterized protein involved in response to NO